MYLLTTVILTTFLMNATAVEPALVKVNPAVAEVRQASEVIDQVAAIEGVDVEYVVGAAVPQSIKVKVESGIVFSVGESVLSNATKSILFEFAQIMVQYPTTHIILIGHTDNSGTVETNQLLSENRAQAVADFLISNNVTVEQFRMIEGKSDSEPVASNSTAAGRAANRHTDLFIVPATAIGAGARSSVAPKAVANQKALPDALMKMLDKIVQQPDKSTDIEIEIDGLLVDDTKTKSGKDFYDLFYDGWEAPPSAKNFTITISEKPFRLTSTMIVVSINENVVYQDILQPRQDVIQAQSEQAVFVTENYLTNYQEIMKELNGDDLTGSGIY